MSRLWFWNARPLCKNTHWHGLVLAFFFLVQYKQPKLSQWGIYLTAILLDLCVKRAIVSFVLVTHFFGILCFLSSLSSPLSFCTPLRCRLENVQYPYHLYISPSTRPGLNGPERPFQCPTCGVRFTRIQNLKQHMLIHSGETKSLCPIITYISFQI